MVKRINFLKFVKILLRRNCALLEDDIATGKIKDIDARLLSTSLSIIGIHIFPLAPSLYGGFAIILNPDNVLLG